ncbi:hypothetical protein OY671_011532, partial [Metschnikowia pulcherrima]
QGGQGDGRRRVAADGFEQDGGLSSADSAQLFGDAEAVFLVGHEDRRQAAQAGHAFTGGSQRGEVAKQGEDLSGVAAEGQRREEAAGAAYQQYGTHGAGYSSVAAHGSRPASGLNYKGCAIGCGKVFANL